MNKLRFILFALLLSTCSCSITREVRTSLTPQDVGKIGFASAGSIVKGADGSYVVNDRPAALSGDLQFPAGTGPFPAVVLAHGCAGPGYADKTWAPLLRRWGYATFVLDSFGGRGISGVCENVWRLVPIERVPDAYGALWLLATHPRIDRNRVILMGFSHGGMLTVNAATLWAKALYAPAGRPRFRGFFPFYPYCNGRYPEREQISAPLRIHMGELDDWTPAKPCREWVDRLKANGYDAGITLYPGAYHGFDDPSGSVIKLPMVQNAAACRPEYPSILGPFDLGKNFSGCMVRGATIGRNVQAIGRARQVLQSQLAELLKAN